MAKLRRRGSATPLLGPSKDQDCNSNSLTPTPLPWKQLAILSYLRLGEAVCFFSIFPFIPRLVIDFGVTDSERKAGYYAGIVESLFSLVQCLTVLQWARLADRIGRKPVLLCGLVGLSSSMMLFGLSRAFWGILLARAVAGAFSANGGVVLSMIGELTDSTNSARAFTLMPLMSGVGGSVGPFIGGLLANPAESWDLFDTPFHRTYPYFLPCFISALIPLTGLIVCIFYVQETLPPKQQKVGQPELENAFDDGPKPLKELMTRPVMIVLATYGLVALCSPSFLALFPLFCFTKIENGGLGISQEAIGNNLAFRGIVTILVQLFLFAPLQNRFGGARALRYVSWLFTLQYGMFPIVRWFALAGWSDAVTLSLAFMMCLWAAGNMTWSTCSLLMMSNAPSRHNLATLNGLMESVGSFMRGIAPMFSNNLFALSVDRGMLDGKLYWVVMVCTALLLNLTSLLVHEPQGTMWSISKASAVDASPEEDIGVIRPDGATKIARV